MEVQKIDTENYRPKHFNNVHESCQSTTSFCLNDLLRQTIWIQHGYVPEAFMDILTLLIVKDTRRT